jgi:chromosome segregation ATPase
VRWHQEVRDAHPAEQDPRIQALCRGTSTYISLSPDPHHHHYPTQKLQNANHLAPGKVRPALTLVGYPDEVAEAIAFVFSDTLICDDAASMQAVTFSREVVVRSVTLEGDVYELSRMMSSGAAPSGSGILVRVQELHAAEERVAQKRRRRSPNS